MSRFIVSTFVVALATLGVATVGCSSAPSESEDTQVTGAEGAVDPGDGKGNVSVQGKPKPAPPAPNPSPRPCLKCEGCWVSWGWNACCEVKEVPCSELPGRAALGSEGDLSE